MKAIKLSIDSESCIKCGKCVRVCPSQILLQKGKRLEIEMRNVDTCIGCGHCVAVCPTGSVNHSEFPARNVHAFNYSDYPTPAQMELLCKARRSNRAFSQKPVPAEMLEKILMAAHYAPTASNLREVQFTLVTSADNLRSISELTLKVLRSTVKKLNTPLLKPVLKLIIPGTYKYLPAFNRLLNEYEKGNDLILRKATAVVLIHTPQKSRFGYADANLAYQNGSLMAECLGVSQFYTGFVCAAIKQDKDNSLAHSLGIEGTIHAGMALGMPDFRFTKYVDRNEISVTTL